MSTSKPATMKSLESLKTVEELKEEYATLCKREVAVNEELEVLQAKQLSIDNKMAKLQNMMPNLQLIQNDSKQLCGMVAFTSTLADNISGKVRQLDIAKGRVMGCSQRVADILDLKFCTDGVQRALHDEDYEQAAAHIHRFLSLDENVIRMSADASEGSTLDTSFRLLHEAQIKVKTVVHNKFDAAVHQKDVASVERFFKTFPLIGEREAGMEKFSKYLCAQLSEASDKNLERALSTSSQDKRADVIFADAITLLFEGIARVVEIHQPLVETYYGPGRVLSLMRHVQKECDRQAKRILDKFKEHRRFHQLSQAVLRSQQRDTDRVNPRDLDVILQEIALLNTRSELYIRFVRRRIMNDQETAFPKEEDLLRAAQTVDQFLMESELSRNMQELIGTYIMMEEYFMHEMVLKAVSLDQQDDEALTSSMVDDSFFIVKKCVRRAMSSASVDGVCAMLNHACAALEQDFREVLLERLRAGFPTVWDLQQAYSFVQASFQQGKLAGSEEETAKTKKQFITALNNAEVSCHNISTLRDNLEQEIEKLFLGSSEQAKAKLQSCLGDLGSASARFKDAQDFGFNQLTTSVTKPQIKPLIDAFIACGHTLTEDEFTNYEANDPWVQDGIVKLDTFLSTFQTSLTSNNYQVLVVHVATELTLQLEKAVLKCSFNRLGGLQFDKEIRKLVAYLSSVTTWTIRDKFARLSQMSTVLNLERVSEVLDYWGANSGPLTWRLTPAEVRQILYLRSDFRRDEVQKLKL